MMALFHLGRTMRKTGRSPPEWQAAGFWAQIHLGQAIPPTLARFCPHGRLPDFGRNVKFPGKFARSGKL